MALNKQAFKTNIVALLTEMLTKEENSIEEFATRLTDAIDAFVKTGTVNITTTGTATTQTGTGTIS
ncbi:MAG: hypothetical protein RLZZ292_392 [Bacteroidota bacterium]|jgi:hypothetical protein